MWLKLLETWLSEFARISLRAFRAADTHVLECTLANMDCEEERIIFEFQQSGTHNAAPELKNGFGSGLHTQQYAYPTAQAPNQFYHSLGGAPSTQPRHPIYPEQSEPGCILSEFGWGRGRPQAR